MSRDFFEMVAKQSFASPDFMDSPNEYMKLLKPEIGNPWDEPIPKDEDIYRGMLLAVAYVQNMTIDTFFKPSFYKLLLGQDLTFHDLRNDDPEMFNSLQWIIEYVV